MKQNQAQSAEHYTYQWGGKIAEFLRTSEAASVTPGKQLDKCWHNENLGLEHSKVNDTCANRMAEKSLSTIVGDLSL